MILAAVVGGECAGGSAVQGVEVDTEGEREEALRDPLGEAARSLRVFLCIGGWLGVVGDALSEVDA